MVLQNYRSPQKLEKLPLGPYRSLWKSGYASVLPTLNRPVVYEWELTSEGVTSVDHLGQFHPFLSETSRFEELIHLALAGVKLEKSDTDRKGKK